ncbi:hypothetical protein Tco_1133279 [Tanacetum coccineum]
MVAFLEKSSGSAGFHQVIDFLNRSHICYALTKKPDVYISFTKQFWRFAEASTDDNGEVKIIASIDGHSLSITEGSLRRHLKLDDQYGITSIPNSKIFEQLALMGYHIDSDKLTFQKGAFSPQWRFLIHNILHCLSPKKTTWEQFSSNIAIAVICLATNRKFNFSRMIFEHMVSNISSPHKFFMYPRFIQICLVMTSPEQTAPDKDFSNPLIVDSLLKTIWSSMHHVFRMKHWLVQSKRLLPSYIHPRSYPTRLLTLSVMANLEFCDKHNMVAFLEKSTGSAGFHQVIDFLNRSHICYALTKKPDVYISFIKQFWRSAEASTDDNGDVQITATIDGHSMSITEASLRRHLKLDDQDGITSIPNSEIFEHMVSNISSPHKFLIYPSIKVFNNMKRPTKGYSGQEVNLFPTMLDVAEPSTSPSRITSLPSHSHEPSPSPEPEPTFEHSLDHTTAAPTQPSPTQPSPTHPSPGAEHHFPTPHDSPLHVVHSHGSDEGSLKLNELTNLVTKLSDRIGVLEDDLRKTKKTYSSAFTKLILRVKKLESQIKTGKTRRKARIVHSDDEDIEDDSSKQGRKLSNAEVQEKASTETEPFIQEVTPTEVIQDQENSEKGSAEVSTAGATKGTASEVPVVSTAEEDISTAGRTVTYRRRSEEQRTRKDKGKAIMIEFEPKKKSKKELEQERLSFAEAIRLEEQMNEEQRAQIARDEEIARQWDEEERQRAMSEAKSTKKIDWNDPSVIRYHALKMKPKTIAQARRNMIKYLKNQGNYKISDFKGMSYNEIRPIFEKVWDFNQHIEPMDMEHGSEKMKSPEKIEEKDVDTQKEVKEVVKEPGVKRKKSLPRKRRIVKRQKLEEDAEKEELKGFLDIIPREEFAEDVESLSTKYPIVDWKTYTLTENFMYYQVFRGDGSSKNYKVLSEMLEDFDRQDVEELYRLVKERYSASRPEGYDLMLWGDLHTLFEPDEEDEIWKNQHEYNVISWSLYDFCGIHILLMQNGIAIHMLTEKKYPLSQEMISKMLKKKLEVDHESSQAFELLSDAVLIDTSYVDVTLILEYSDKYSAQHSSIESVGSEILWYNNEEIYSSIVWDGVDSTDCAARVIKSERR